MSAFQGATNTTINGGNFTAVSTTVANLRTQDDIVALLFSHSATAGLLNAAERFDAPRCDEGTRVSMLLGMENFVQDSGSSTPSALYWLHGPAGVGKSALAQSLSLSLDSEGDHAASFFFSRTSPGRNNGNQLFLTLAYQLMTNCPPLRRFMSNTVKRNPSIITSSRATQMHSLIVDPINQWQKSYRGRIQRWGNKILKKKLHPRLILVDGLDECNDPDVQRDIILCIASAIHQLSLPFRFVITSRPEPHILAMFELDPVFQGLNGVKVTKKNLGEDEDADAQITLYLIKQFTEIQRTHPIRNFLPQPWPLPRQIAEIVSKSSGGFVYPATIIRYIRMPNNRPDECLDRILGLSAIPSQDKPFEPLDRLYRHIFESLPQANKGPVRKIFHFLVIPHAMDKMITPRIIERYFKLRPGQVEHTLHDLLSIVAFNTYDDPIKVLHASLPDFLLDRSRSGSLYINIGNAHATVAASYYRFFLSGSRCLDASIFSKFLDHLIQANTTTNLLRALKELDLVEAYRVTIAITWSTSRHGSLVAKINIPPDQYLQLITCLLVYLLVLSTKSIPSPQFRALRDPLETFIVQNHPCAAALQTIDEATLSTFFPALRYCAVNFGPKCIETQSQISQIVQVFPTGIATEIWTFYLLLLSPFFTPPEEYGARLWCDNFPAPPVEQGSELAHSLLRYLRLGPQTSMFATYQSRQGRSFMLIEGLVAQITELVLVESRYYALLIDHLIRLSKEVDKPVRGGDDIKIFARLSSAIFAYCTRVYPEASQDRSQLKKLDGLIAYISREKHREGYEAGRKQASKGWK